MRTIAIGTRRDFLAGGAVVTLTQSGGLKIEGMESTYCFGVSPEKVGWGCDGDGHATTAKVQSVNMNVNYV